MNYIIKFMPRAKIELGNIFCFIALDNQNRAETFTKELIEHFIKLLSVFPELGEKYNLNVRKITYKGYSAFYRIKKLKKEVEILHISSLRKPIIISKK